MGQRSFSDEQQRVATLREKKPVLKRLSESIPWELFHSLHDRGYTQQRKINAGRKRIDPLIIFKMLVLLQVFNLSDEEIEFLVNDRRSFEEFVGLGVVNAIHDATTVAFFTPPLTEATLRALFTKPYGAPTPSAEQCRAEYDDAVHFQNPTQEKQGIEAYIAAQEGLMKRCDDVFLEPGAVALDGTTAFVERTMGLKIKGNEFIYPGTTRLRIGADGTIVEHRDYFDFVGPTFAPVQVVGGFVRWLYRRFVS